MRSKRYEDTVSALICDPIIIAMARELPVLPSQGDLMLPALREYKSRGGKVRTHIGGPAEAIERLKRRSSR